MKKDFVSSSSSTLGEGERTPKHKNDTKCMMLFPQQENEYLEPVKFETLVNKRIHILPRERSNFFLTAAKKNDKNNAKEELSIETIDIDTIISLQRVLAKKNLAIFFLSVVFVFITLGLVVIIKNKGSAVDTSNSFHLFETTFEWYDNCLRVTSYAHYTDTCEGYLDEISSWYE